MEWEKQNGTCDVGPQSVGHELTSKALAAGGDACTATDVAVLLRKMEFGNAELVKAGDQHFTSYTLGTGSA